MKKVGITGGIGSGKSVVGRLFQVLGVPLYDSDARAKWVMTHDSTLRADLQGTFGPETFTTEGDLNRPYLARVAFHDPTQLARLNALVHPTVGRDFVQWATAQQQAGHAYVLKEAALLFESGAYQQLDCILTVFAPLAIREARVLRRDSHRTPEDVAAIMGKQLSEEEKMQCAHYVIYNDNQQPLLPQVLRLHNELLQL